MRDGAAGNEGELGGAGGPLDGGPLDGAVGPPDGAPLVAGGPLDGAGGLLHGVAAPDRGGAGGRFGEPPGGVGIGGGE